MAVLIHTFGVWPDFECGPSPAVFAAARAAAETGADNADELQRALQASVEVGQALTVLALDRTTMRKYRTDGRGRQSVADGSSPPDDTGHELVLADLLVEHTLRHHAHLCRLLLETGRVAVNTAHKTSTYTPLAAAVRVHSVPLARLYLNSGATPTGEDLQAALAIDDALVVSAFVASTLCAR